MENNNYSYIFNPYTKKKFNINGIIGKNILTNYLKSLNLIGGKIQEQEIENPMISNEIILDLVKNHEGIILDDTVCDRRLITDILQNTEIDIILNNDGKKIIISN